MRLAPVVLLLLAASSLACGTGVPVSPLAGAARAGDLAAIDCLLDAGADINAGSGVNDWPPVIHAVHKGQTEALRHLLERGASVEGSVGRRALDMASSDGNDTMVRLLVAYQVQPKAATLAVP